jgi:hypothetical protein
MSDIINLFKNNIFKPLNLDEINKAHRLGLNKGYNLNLSKLLTNQDLFVSIITNLNNLINKLELSFDSIVCANNPIDIYIASCISTISNKSINIIKTPEERDLKGETSLVEGKININTNYLIITTILDYKSINHLHTQILNKGGDIENILVLFNLCEGDDEIIKTKYKLSVNSYITLDNILELLLSKNLIDNFIYEKINHIKEIAIKDKIIEEKKTNVEQIAKFTLEDKTDLYYKKYLKWYINNFEIFEPSTHNINENLKKLMSLTTEQDESNTNLNSILDTIKLFTTIDLLRANSNSKDYKPLNNMIINLSDRKNITDILTYIKIMENKLSYIVNFNNIEFNLNELVDFFTYVRNNNINIIYNHTINDLNIFKSNSLFNIDNTLSIGDIINNVNNYSNNNLHDLDNLYNIINNNSATKESDLVKYYTNSIGNTFIRNMFNNIIVNLHINNIDDIINFDNFVNNNLLNNKNIVLKLSFNNSNIKSVFKNEKLWTRLYGVLNTCEKLNIFGIILNYSDLYKNNVSIPKKIKFDNIVPLILNIDNDYKFDESYLNENRNILNEYIEREELLINTLKKTKFSHIIYNDNILIRQENNTIKYTNTLIIKYFNMLFYNNNLNIFNLDDKVLDVYKKFRREINKAIFLKWINNYYNNLSNNKNLLKTYPFNTKSNNFKELEKTYNNKLNTLNKNKNLIISKIEKVFETNKKVELTNDYRLLEQFVISNTSNVYEAKKKIYKKIFNLIYGKSENESNTSNTFNTSNTSNTSNTIWNMEYGIGMTATLGYNIFVAPIKYLLGK